MVLKKIQNERKRNPAQNLHLTKVYLERIGITDTILDQLSVIHLAGLFLFGK